MKKIWIVFLLIIVLFLFTFNRPAAGEEQDAEKHPAAAFLEPQLVFMPGGKFVMGKKLPPAKEGEKKKYVNNPAHNVELGSFYIDKYEVTNYQYFLFCFSPGMRLHRWGQMWFLDGTSPLGGRQTTPLLATVTPSLPRQQRVEYIKMLVLLTPHYINSLFLGRCLAERLPS